MTQYVLSTMTQSVSYNIYDPRAQADNPRLLHSILIRGGAGIASHRSGFGEQQQALNGLPIWTADGYVTPVDDRDFDLLKDHKVFKKHLDSGLLRVIKTDITGNHRAVQKEAKTMERDGFQPLNHDTLKQRIKVSTATAPVEQEFRL